MNGPLFTFTHGFDSVTGKPTALFKFNCSDLVYLYAHQRTPEAAPSGYVRYYLDSTSTGTGAFGTFDVPYTAGGSWNVWAQFGYDTAIPCLVLSIDDVGSGTGHVEYVYGHLSDGAKELLSCSAELSHPSTSISACTGVTGWPGYIFQSATATRSLANISPAPPTGGALFTGAHGEQWVARFCKDLALTGASQMRQRIYFRGCEDDPWSVSLDVSVSSDWGFGGALYHGYMAAGQHDGSEMFPYRLVKRYVVSSGQMQSSIDLGDTWAPIEPDDEDTITRRATAWHPARNSSMIAIYRPDVAGGEHVTAFCMPQETFGGGTLVDYLADEPFTPLPTSTTIKVRDDADNTGPRPYPFIWPSDDDARSIMGCVTAGLYREWTMPAELVAGTGVVPELTHSSASPADMDCFCFAIWTSTNDGTQMLTGYNGSDGEVKTWYRVGRTGTWGSVRAEWAVSLATCPYCYHRDDGQWEVGWLDPTSWEWVQYRSGDPAASSGDWTAV